MAPALDRRIEWAVAVLLFGVFAAAAAAHASNLANHVMIGWGEGWNAYFAHAAGDGGVLYPGPPALAVNNYPPLSFLVVGALGRLMGGDDVVAGRIVAWCSTAIVAINIALLSRRMGATPRAAVIASAAFLVMFAILTPDYVGEDEPQMFGHALATTGAVIFLREPATRAAIVLAAALMVAAMLVKLNLAPLGLALAAWAALHDRRRLAWFVLAGAAIGLACALACYAVWGRAFIDSVVFGSRFTSWSRFWLFSGVALQKKFFIPMLTIAAAGLILNRSSRYAGFVLFYILFAAAIGFFSLSGDGVNYNALYDLCIALALGVALAIGWPGAGARRAALLSLVAVLGLYSAFYFSSNPPSLGEQSSTARQDQALLNILARADGPVACDSLIYCFWAGKPLELDFFAYGEMRKTGRLPVSALKTRVERHYYRYILINIGDYETVTGRVPVSALWPPPMPDEDFQPILANYQPIGQFDGDVLLGARR